MAVTDARTVFARPANHKLLSNVQEDTRKLLVE